MYTSPDGEYLQLINVASAADCNTTVNSWFSDGVTLYVRLIDDRAPDDDLLAFLETTCGVDDGAYKLWIKGVNFVGVQSVFVRLRHKEAVSLLFMGGSVASDITPLKGQQEAVALEQKALTVTWLNVMQVLIGMTG